MKILTFVIPAYNSERFLDKCISSMLVPEVLSKIEIIVVNDGSTDATAEVAEKYCTQYPGTVRLICQENKGHGGALNTGCAAAKGKYLKVIDSDDWVESQNLPAFIARLEECESDVVLTHYRTHNISSGQVRDWMCTPKAFHCNYSLPRIVADWRNFYQLLTFHGITYRTDFYRSCGIALSEHVFYEDYEFATFPCCQAESIYPVDLFLYDYRIGDVNQSVSDTSKLKRIGHLEQVLDRMMQEYPAAARIQGGCDYAAIKIQELLLSYLKVALLIDPQKKNGRKQAAAMMQRFWEQLPKVAELAEKKYRVFLGMNYLHISNRTWESFVNSSAYRLLRGK